MHAPTSPKQVLLVDDDPWTRGGAIAALGADPRLLVRADSVAGALGSRRPVQADVLVIDVRAPDDPRDRFRGVEVIDRLRHLDRSDGRRRLAVVMAAEPVDPLLAVRVAEAGADHLRPWAETREEDLLRAVVHGSSSAPLDVRELKEDLGLDPDGCVNDFLAELARDELLDAFAPGTTQRGSGVPRRRSIALRRRALDVAGLRPAISVGSQPLQIPSWRQVRAFVNAARGLGWDHAVAGPDGPSDVDRYNAVS